MNIRFADIREPLKTQFERKRAIHAVYCVKPPNRAPARLRRLSLYPTQLSHFLFSKRFLEVPIKNDRKDLEAIERLYTSAFPSDERAPFRMLVRGAEKKNVDFFSCSDGDEWAGFLYTVNDADLSYIFYFAVDEKKRGAGIGTAILRAAQEFYRGRRLFLAIEETDRKYENYDERIKRLHFYENAGFVRTGQKMQEADVIFELMSVNGPVRNKEYRKLMRSFMGLRMLFITLKIFED